MKSDIEQSAAAYTEELKAELDRRYADYKSGMVELISAEESKQRIKAILSGNE